MTSSLSSMKRGLSTVTAVNDPRKAEAKKIPVALNGPVFLRDPKNENRFNFITPPLPDLSFLDKKPIPQSLPIPSNKVGEEKKIEVEKLGGGEPKKIIYKNVTLKIVDGPVANTPKVEEGKKEEKEEIVVGPDRAKGETVRGAKEVEKGGGAAFAEEMGGEVEKGGGAPTAVLLNELPLNVAPGLWVINEKITNVLPGLRLIDGRTCAGGMDIMRVEDDSIEDYVDLDIQYPIETVKLNAITFFLTFRNWLPDWYIHKFIIQVLEMRNARGINQGRQCKINRIFIAREIGTGGVRNYQHTHVLILFSNEGAKSGTHFFNLGDFDIPGYMWKTDVRKCGRSYQQLLKYMSKQVTPSVVSEGQEVKKDKVVPFPGGVLDEPWMEGVWNRLISDDFDGKIEIIYDRTIFGGPKTQLFMDEFRDRHSNTAILSSIPDKHRIARTMSDFINHSQLKPKIIGGINYLFIRLDLKRPLNDAEYARLSELRLGKIYNSAVEFMPPRIVIFTTECPKMMEKNGVMVFYDLEAFRAIQVNLWKVSSLEIDESDMRNEDFVVFRKYVNGVNKAPVIIDEESVRVADILKNLSMPEAKNYALSTININKLPLHFPIPGVDIPLSGR